jgi:predicted ATPase|tara:strand:- start:467 stop:793 length:327 start_codon:yes stop_codon:yes gene_type:complete
MKLRCAHVFDNIQRVANSKVLEQGNALVFALDKSMREVRFFQDHIRSYESELRTAIHQEFRLLLAEQGQAMSSKDKTIKDMHERMVHTVNDLIIKEQLRCNEAIKKKA